ncbi:hypothetical protein POM88_019896 [Heracleum sosnowskyi]|uniref:DUF4220 domain-containing protein n=1 Tax=Heracleum sosnowskyi TaxID=360622 RepID=A0AAD8IAU2_9APIA|nr:hypothetical protein POM88_019896 [Heracleum sosnowskyi]
MSHRSIMVKLDEIIDEWELWACLLLSLFLQIFLSFGGTFRRLVSHKWIVVLLWLAYLLAEIIALVGLGIIASRQSFIFKSSKYTYDTFEFRVSFFSSEDRLQIFWAPFLLVHLGGPDTITAFAPEDNELWPRHLFYLASQCTAVAYAFYQSHHLDNHLLMMPMLLMCFCGITKCIERTAALYYGSANSFRNSMLSESDKKEPKLPIKKNGDAFSHLQFLQYAFVYFTAFKGLVVDLNLNIYERNQSREFFLATSCEDAFKLVEVELNYLYDVLFTKIPVLHHKLGYYCRTLSFTAVVASLTLFHLECNSFTWRNDSSKLDPKVKFDRPIHNNKFDVLITYILLIGAVVLEVIAFYMLLFCDWTIIKLRPLYAANQHGKSWKDKLINCVLSVNCARSVLLHWFLHIIGDRNHHNKSSFTDSRWASSLSAFNLIYYCLHRCSKRRENVYSYFGLINFLNGIWYAKPQPLTHHLTHFIFDELKMKSEMADSLAKAKEICSSKGERVLHEMEEYTFLPFIVNYNYDDILLLWHIATDLCYNNGSLDPPTTKEQEQRDTAKKLSDYMLYLMAVKPDMMSRVSSIGEKKFRDTCTEVSKFLDTKVPKPKKKLFCNLFRRKSKEEKEAIHKKACETILSVNREVEHVNVQMDRDIFFNAFLLAKELNVLPSDKKWLMISKLWVELLSYAAIHIRSSAHAEQLSKGGELITVVWLLMAHFGLGEQYEISRGKQA